MINSPTFRILGQSEHLKSRITKITQHCIPTKNVDRLEKHPNFRTIFLDITDKSFIRFSGVLRGNDGVWRFTYFGANGEFLGRQTIGCVGLVQTFDGEVLRIPAGAVQLRIADHFVYNFTIHIFV